MSPHRVTRTAVLPLAVILSALLALAGPGEASAQAPDLEVAVWGGPAVPVGDLAKVTDTGVSVGMGLAYPLGRRFRLRTDVMFFSRPGAEVEGGRPVDIHERFLTLGGDLELTPGVGRWDVAAQLGAGVSILSSDPISVPGRVRSLQLAEEKFAAYAGLEARYEVSRDVRPFLRARGTLSTAGRSLGVFRLVDPSVARSGLFLSVPVEAGLTITF